jgi:predicted extracellular nuclease
MKITSIAEVQGSGLWSGMAGQVVTVRGVVTAVGSRGFYMQSPESSADPAVSDAVYVFSLDWQAIAGELLEVNGKVLDYIKNEHGKPVTQIKLHVARTVRHKGPRIKPFELTADNVPADAAELAAFLNGLEGMLVSIEPGQTFISPSNAFGDYVLILDAKGPIAGVTRTAQGGVLVEHQNPLRWYPGFRISNYARAPRLNVGAKLLSRIVGPLNYRVEAWQISVDRSFKFEPGYFSLSASSLKPEAGYLSILTLNGFNLDVKVESELLVKNPRLDIDDDMGDGRFHTLAQAVVLQANVPDVIALQEIQDNDGAELTEVIDASKTYALLIDRIRELCGIEYRWIDIAPAVGADGGQPGGGIRNGYLYNPQRVELISDSVRSIGLEEAAFEGSRKPLVAHFREITSKAELVCINVHLASKRHQRSIFAPEQPGFDEKAEVRHRQAQLIHAELALLQQQNLDYYLTGDFNDTEASDTLVTIAGEHGFNLVGMLKPEQRYDYNHRGKLQVLMHGIVAKAMLNEQVEFEVIHGNELLGVKPGELGSKPTDHAYVIAKIKLRPVR